MVLFNQIDQRQTSPHLWADMMSDEVMTQAMNVIVAESIASILHLLSLAE